MTPTQQALALDALQSIVEQHDGYCEHHIGATTLSFALAHTASDALAAIASLEAAPAAVAEPAEPDGTLHDDGCFTWKPGKCPAERRDHRAGWRADFYLAPVAVPPPTEPSAEVVLPPVPPTRRGFVFYHPEDMEAYARAAILADRAARTPTAPTQTNHTKE